MSLSDNALTDINPLADVTNLETVSLSGNELTDLSPLLALTRLRAVSAKENCLDVADGSETAQVLRVLEARGVNVSFDDQKVCEK